MPAWKEKPPLLGLGICLTQRGRTNIIFPQEVHQSRQENVAAPLKVRNWISNREDGDKAILMENPSSTSVFPHHPRSHSKHFSKFCWGFLLNTYPPPKLYLHRNTLKLHQTGETYIYTHTRARTHPPRAAGIFLPTRIKGWKNWGRNGVVFICGRFGK